MENGCFGRSCGADFGARHTCAQGSIQLVNARHIDADPRIRCSAEHALRLVGLGPVENGMGNQVLLQHVQQRLRV
ncbi:hypothetical protein D3C78_1731260 [compost metagenome]